MPCKSKLTALSIAVLLASARLCAADDATATADADAKFAKAFEQHIVKQEADPAEPMLDAGALIDRSQAGIAAPKDLAAGFKDGALPIGKQEIGLLIQQGVGGGKFKFVRVHQRAGKTIALFRVQTPDDSVDYLEWYIEPDANGHRRFVDIYDVARGELVSQTLRRVYIAAVIAEDKTAPAKFGAKEKDLVDNMSKVKELTQAAQAGEYQKVIDIYKSLPATVQAEKSVLYLRVCAANQLTDTKPQEYESAIADFQKAFPGDPAIDLLGLAHLVNANQYAAAHQAVDRLIAFTGGDSHLDCMHAEIYAAAGKPADITSAIDSYKKAIAAEPDDSEGYWGLVAVYLQAKDYASTAAELTEIQQKLHLEMKDLNSVPLYADFVKSPEYKKWLAGQKAAAPQAK